MSPLDLVALLVLWVVFRLIRGAFSVARRPTGRPAAPEGQAVPSDATGEVQQVPPPPITAARGGREERSAGRDWTYPRDISIPEIGIAAETNREMWSDREETSSIAQRRKARRKSSARGSGDLGGLIAKSPLVGGLILREALGRPRSLNPHRPGPRV